VADTGCVVWQSEGRRERQGSQAQSQISIFEEQVTPASARHVATHIISSLSMQRRFRV
jgi:hypothetical protein